jgi:hypothetical protein
MSRGWTLAIFAGGIALSIILSLATHSLFVFVLLPLFFLGGSLTRR